MGGNGFLAVDPFALVQNIAIAHSLDAAHRSVVELPAAERISPVHVAVGVVGVDLETLRIGIVDLVLLPFHVILRCGNRRRKRITGSAEEPGAVVRKARPFVGDAMGGNADRGRRPRAVDDHRTRPHGLLAARIPAAERVGSVHVAVLVVRVHRVLCWIRSVDGEFLTGNELGGIGDGQHRSSLVASLVVEDRTRGEIPFVGDGIGRDGLRGVGPCAFERHVGIAHNLGSARCDAVLRPAAERVGSVHVAVLVVRVDRIARAVDGIHLIGLAAYEAGGRAGKGGIDRSACEIEEGDVIGQIPSVRNAMSFHLDRRKLPRARNGHVGFAHDAVARIVPTLEGIGAVDVAVGVFHVHDRFIRRVRVVDFVWLAFYQTGQRCRQGQGIERGAVFVKVARVRGKIPCVHDVVRGNVLRLVRPRTGNRYGVGAHDAVIRIVPTAERVDTRHVAVLIVLVDRCAGREIGVDRIVLIRLETGYG